MTAVVNDLAALAAFQRWLNADLTGGGVERMRVAIQAAIPHLEGTGSPRISLGVDPVWAEALRLTTTIFAGTGKGFLDDDTRLQFLEVAEWFDLNLLIPPGGAR